MKTFEKKTREYDALIAMTCDLCGRVSSCSDWSGGGYGVEETQIKLEEGFRCPDGGNTTTTEFHVCPLCFRDKLIPWMTSQGAKPTITEVDF